MEITQKCEAGCKNFSGGEVRHHKDCIHYEESMSQRYDEMKVEISLLNKRINDDKETIISDFLKWWLNVDVSNSGIIQYYLK